MNNYWNHYVILGYSLGCPKIHEMLKSVWEPGFPGSIWPTISKKSKFVKIRGGLVVVLGPFSLCSKFTT